MSSAKRNLELLAPAGSLEAATAAVEAGANAFYLGGKLFGARHYAPNFDDETLAGVVRYAHLRGVFVYITVNTLVDNSEIPALVSYLRFLYEIGVDAILVQDVGVAAIAAKVVPHMPLHASTQMTIHNLAGVEFLAKQGFSRVVLAREVSLDDIKHICSHSPIEIETFGHGALCICYSGQCLMSSMIGGRSGNRGQCAQPCRLPYSLVGSEGNLLSPEDAGEYLLSPKDLCTLELLPQLIEAGVASFKLEGRMKRPEYVAIAVDTYRQAIDRYSASPSTYSVFPEEVKDLAQSFNRGFTSAYLLKNEGPDMMSDRRPNNRGVHIGRVTGYDAKHRTAIVKLEAALAVGDIVECWVKVGGRVNITVSSLMVNGQAVETAQAGDEVAIPVQSPVKLNDRVFKTFDIRLTTKARSFFAEGDGRRKLGVDVSVSAHKGQPLMVTLQDEAGYSGQAATAFITEAARNRPLDDDVVAKQLGRLGNTAFSLRSLTADIDPGVMVPLSEINDARRRAVESLEQDRLASFSRPPLPAKPAELLPQQSNRKSWNRPELSVNVDTIEKAEVALEQGADIVLFGGETYSHQPITAEEYRKVVAAARQRNKRVVLTTPRIVKEWQTPLLRKTLELFNELAPDAISVTNPGTIEIAKQITNLPLTGDFPLNIFNVAAVNFYAEHGLVGMTLSPELTFTQIADITGRVPVSLECLVHGRLPLMISEHCIVGSRLGGRACGSCNAICQQRQYWLHDRKGERFPVVTDQFGRMHILNAKELSLLPHVAQFGRIGVNVLRIEAKAEEPARMGRIVRLYHRLLDLEAEPSIELLDQISSLEQEHITRGHYFRGVLKD
jgi:putative protease